MNILTWLFAPLNVALSSPRWSHIHQSMVISTPVTPSSTRFTMLEIFLIISALTFINAKIITEDIQFLNELPLDKLMKLKNSLQELVTTESDNVTSTSPTYLNSFGAEAMAIRGPPIKRGDWEESVWKKGSYSKISNIFSMSVTTLAFLAFGGYLLCLIVHAIKQKQMYLPATTVQPTTFFVSAGIKKRPQPQFAAYGRRRRENRNTRSLKQIDLPPEQLFSALMRLCEGYAKWSERYGNDTSWSDYLILITSCKTSI